MKQFLKIALIFGILLPVKFAVNAQQRECDLIPQIVSPTKGYLFKSPSDTEIKTAIINLGPDSIFIGDNYGIRFFFGSLITNNVFRKFYKNLAPGDTAFDTYTIHINLVGDVPVKFCTEILRWADDTTTLAREYGAAKKIIKVDV